MRKLLIKLAAQGFIVDIASRLIIGLSSLEVSDSQRKVATVLIILIGMVISAFIWAKGPCDGDSPNEGESKHPNNGESIRRSIPPHSKGRDYPDRRA